MTPTLASRVEKATGPDREIDAEINVAFRIGTPKTPDWARRNFPIWASIGGGRCACMHDDGRHGLSWESPTYTASLDAAVALIGRKLPGAGWEIAYGGGPWHGEIQGRPSWKAEHRTPALALLLAFLRAVEEREG